MRAGLAREHTDRGLERQRAPLALAHPVPEHERGVAGVAHQVDVRAAVAQAEHRGGVRQDLEGGVEVPAVAAEEVVHQRLAVVGDGPVVQEVGGVTAERDRLRREARRRIGLVFRERGRREHALGLRQHQLVEARPQVEPAPPP